MNTKAGVAFNIIAVAAVKVLFTSGSLPATQARAFGGLHRSFSFHHFPFHHYNYCYYGCIDNLIYTRYR